MWESISTTFKALTSTIVTVSTSLEKTVQLYENEVDNLHAEQHNRLARCKAERDDAIEALPTIE